MSPSRFAALVAGVALLPGLLAPVGAASQEGVDTVRILVEGEVVDDQSGRPVQGARVSLDGTLPRLPSLGPHITGRDGGFRFTAVPVGVYRLHVEAEGFDPMLDSLPVRDGPQIRFVLPLSRGGGSLEPRAVATDPGTEGGRDYRGRRRRGGAGFLITREEILERRPRTLSEMLGRVPGGMLVPSGTGGYTLLLRNQCQPGIWVDGVRLGAANLDQVVSPNEVEALEVYHGFELPVEFGVSSCGGILVWTRRGLEIPPPADADDDAASGSGRGFLGRLLQVVLVVAIVLVVTR